MIDLFLSELRRFRNLALALAGGHLLLLLFLQRTSNLLQQSYFEAAPMFAGYLLAGLALALVQVGSYRKPSQWLWLIHRPLPTSRIFGALALSATVLLLLAVLLPQLVMVAGLDLFTTHVVDTRHYLTLVHVLAFSLMAWLAGAHAVLSRHKAAIALLPVPVMMGLHLISVWWLLLPMLLALGWMYFVAMHSFRPNREAPPRSLPALLLTALPLQLGFFLLAFGVGQLAFVIVSILLGTDPLNTPYPPKGGLIEISRKEPADAMILGLQDSRDPRAASWREQLPLLEPVFVGAWLQRFPMQHQLSNLQMPTEWIDEQRGIRWTFSHDRMQFHGRDPRSGADFGWWGLQGVGDDQPFTAVPIAAEHDYLLTPDSLYVIDQEAQRQHRILQLESGEHVIDMPNRAFNRLMVLTNRRLLALREDRQAESRFAPLLLDWQLPVPADPEQLGGAYLVEMMDGWLVSFLFDDGHRQIGFRQFNVIAQPWQQVSFVDSDGRSTEVAQRQIRRDYPAMQQVSWWISPPLHILSELPETLLDNGFVWPVRTEWLPSERPFHITAAVLTLASLLAAIAWLRGARIPHSRRRLWLASCAVLGLPAFISLVCLEPRATRG